MTSSDPDAVEAKKLVEDQYYPPIRRYNEIISILKHLPDENGDLALELPAPSYFFERAQTELFEMIQYLNIVISRYLASAQVAVRREVQLKNKALIDQQLEQSSQVFCSAVGVQPNGIVYLAGPTSTADGKLTIRPF